MTRKKNGAATAAAPPAATDRPRNYAVREWDREQRRWALRPERFVTAGGASRWIGGQASGLFEVVRLQAPAGGP